MDLIVTSQNPACIHHPLEGNVQEFVLIETSRRAVDELFALVETVESEALNNDPAHQAYPGLIDSTVGLLPLNYTFNRMYAVINKYPSIRRARVAILVSPNPLSKTISMMMRGLMSVRFYMPAEREQALAWLREDSKAAANR
jgi:hypothetical protein